MTFLFHFSAMIVLPFWLAMIAAPNAKWTERLIRSPWIILPPVVCYLAFALPNMPEMLGAFRDPSPESLAAMMAAPWAASLFWAYAGAFDLFVGRWIYLDAREREIHHAFVAPPLIVTIFFGPIGFALYGLVRAGQALIRRGEAA